MGNILHDADKATARDRNAVYGHPADDFARTAAIANAMGFTRNGEPITAEDIPIFQIAVKMSRLSNTPDHRDTIVDIAGYARTLEMVHERNEGEQ